MTRPTTDRVREAMFSTVESTIGSLAGTAALDLYAGSGAVGLEALSRGALSALLVESDARAVSVLRENVDRVGLAGAVVRHAAVERVLAQPPTAPFDFAFLDPPYATGEQRVALVLTLLGNWVGPEGLVVLERPTRGPDVAWPAWLRAAGERRYGETTLWYGRRTG